MASGFSLPTHPMESFVFNESAISASKSGVWFSRQKCLQWRKRGSDGISRPLPFKLTSEDRFASDFTDFRRQGAGKGRHWSPQVRGHADGDHRLWPRSPLLHRVQRRHFSCVQREGQRFAGLKLVLQGELTNS
jgi:hypothetical protein